MQLRFYVYVEVSQNGGTPVHHPFIDGMFHCKPPSDKGDVSFYGNPYV